MALGTEVAHLCFARETVQSHRGAVFDIANSLLDCLGVGEVALLLTVLLVVLGVVGIWIVVAMYLRIVAGILCWLGWLWAGELCAREGDRLIQMNVASRGYYLLDDGICRPALASGPWLMASHSQYGSAGSSHVVCWVSKWM